MTTSLFARPLVASFAGACALATNATAQTAEAPPLEFTVTAYRDRTPIARSGSSVTVITAEEVAKTNPATILDALRGTPGLSIASTGGPASLSTVFLRGAESRHTMVLIDGVRINDVSSTGGEFDFANLVATDIDRIEILRGPQSALYGSDAIGGVINVITRRGRGDPKASVLIEGGSYGTLSTRMSVTGSTPNFSYSLGFLASRSDGFSAYGYRIPRLEALYGPFDKDGYARLAGSGRFAWRLSDSVEIEAGFYAGRLRSGYDAAFAGFGFLPDTPSQTRSFVATTYARANIDSLDGQLKHRVTLYSALTDRTNFDVQRYDFGFGLTEERNQYDFLGRRVGVEYQGDLLLGPYGKLIYGGVVERESARTATVPGLNSFNANDIAHYARNSAALFSLYQLTLFDRLDLSFGGRLDNVQDVQRFVTGRTTAAYRIEETGTKLRATLGTGAKAPSLYQQYSIYGPTQNGDPALRPETSIGFDAGLDQSFAGGRATLSATVFLNRIRNLIDFASARGRPGPFGPTGQYVNVARARIWGVELSGEAVVVPDLVSLRGAYTYLRATDETTGLILPRRPNHEARFSLNWTPIEKLSIEPTLFIGGERFSTRNEVDRLAPFARLDARIEYQATRNLAVYVRAENIADARYQEVKDYGVAGRSFYGGVRATW